MRFIGLVTSDAVGGGLRKLDSGRVTGRAVDARMAARQRHVRETMVERLLVDLNNFGVPALVLGVTGLALDT